MTAFGPLDFRERGRHLPHIHRQRAHRAVQRLRDQDDEHRAQDRPGQRSQAAYDDQRQQLNGYKQIESLDGDKLEIPSQQSAGHACVERGHRKGCKLSPKQIDPHGLGRSGMLADCRERPPQARAQKVRIPYAARRSAGQNDQVVPAARAEIDPENGRPAVTTISKQM